MPNENKSRVVEMRLDTYPDALVPAVDRVISVLIDNLSSGSIRSKAHAHSLAQEMTVTVDILKLLRLRLVGSDCGDMSQRIDAAISDLEQNIKLILDFTVGPTQ